MGFNLAFKELILKRFENRKKTKSYILFQDSRYSEGHLLVLFDVSILQDDITKFSQNVGNQLPSDTASYISYRLKGSGDGGANGAAAPGGRNKGAEKWAVS
jgi:hypothetical protein